MNAKCDGIRRQENYTEGNDFMTPETVKETPEGGLLIRDLLADLDSQVIQALDHQRRLTREAEILQAKCEVAGEYRVKFMDLRDKLRAEISAANAPAMARPEPPTNTDR
jgi:hypothetical protein